MNLKLLTLFLLFHASVTFGQEDFIDSLEREQSDYSSAEYVQKALTIPFDQISAAPVKSTRFLSNALKRAQHIQDIPATAKLYSLLATSTYYEGKYDLSLDYNLKAIALFDELNDKVQLGDAYATLGHQIKRRDLKKGMHYMRKGIAILKQTDAEDELARAYNNFGVLHLMNAHPDSALTYFSDGLKIVRQRNDSLGIPYSLINMAYAYVEMGKYELVLPYLDEALEIRKARNDQNGMAETLTNYAEYYAAKNDYNKAIEVYLQSQEIATRIGYRNLAKHNAFELSKCYEQIGNVQQALQYLKEAEELEDQLLNEQTNSTIAALEVQFETERKEKELAEHKTMLQEQQVRDTRKNYLLGGLGILFVLFLGVGFLIRRNYVFKQQQLKTENALKDQLAAEQLKNELHEERLRISRDLHDNIGSQLSYLTSSMDNLKYVSTETTVNSKLDELTDFTRDTVGKLRDTIWAMNRETLTLNELEIRISNYLNTVRSLLKETEIVFQAEISDFQVPLSPTQGIYIFRIMQEAINNAAKYALSSQITVRLTDDGHTFSLSVRDNGIGFNPEVVASGDGLKNMRYRSEEINGKVEIHSTVGVGTEIVLTVGLERKGG